MLLARHVHIFHTCVCASYAQLTNYHYQESYLYLWFLQEVVNSWCMNMRRKWVKSKIPLYKGWNRLEQCPFIIGNLDPFAFMKYSSIPFLVGCWIIYKVLDNKMEELVAYELMSANDAPERDPMDWYYLQGIWSNYITFCIIICCVVSFSSDLLWTIDLFVWSIYTSDALPHGEILY